MAKTQIETGFVEAWADHGAAGTNHPLTSGTRLTLPHASFSPSVGVLCNSY